MSDTCRTYEIDGYTVQENGIVRNAEGILIGRLSELDRQWINPKEGAR